MRLKALRHWELMICISFAYVVVLCKMRCMSFFYPELKYRSLSLSLPFLFAFFCGGSLFWKMRCMFFSTVKMFVFSQEEVFISL